MYGWNAAPGNTHMPPAVRYSTPALGTMVYSPGGAATLTAAVKPELAHVVGLDHVPDPTQLMAATMSEQVHDFASGDLSRLAMHGTGKCRPAV